MKRGQRSSSFEENAVLPVKARLDAEEVHEKIHFAAPFARTWARAMIGSIWVSLSSHEFGRKPIQMRLCIGLPKLSDWLADAISGRKRIVSWTYRHRIALPKLTVLRMIASEINLVREKFSVSIDMEQGLYARRDISLDFNSVVA